MEDPQTKEEDDAIDKAKEVNEELKSNEDTDEIGKFHQYHSGLQQKIGMYKK